MGTVVLRRSVLASPGSSEKMLGRSAESDADVAFIDLEDAVAPDAKEGARSTAVAALNDLRWRPPTVAVRINQPGSRWCHRDLTEVIGQAGHRVDHVIVPKVLAPRDVWYVDTLLDELEQAHALEPGRIGIEVLVEDASALVHLTGIASASPRVRALTLGFADLAASLGVRPDLGDPRQLWLPARTNLVAVARTFGLDPIDGAVADYTDLSVVRADAAAAAALGLVGKWAIHPAQIAPINETFTPDPAAVADAREVIEALEAGGRSGIGAVAVHGRLVDAASARACRDLVARADAIAALRR